MKIARNYENSDFCDDEDDDAFEGFWVGQRAALETVIGLHHFLICPLIAAYFSSDAFSIISNGRLRRQSFLNINNTFWKSIFRCIAPDATRDVCVL